MANDPDTATSTENVRWIWWIAGFIVLALIAYWLFSSTQYTQPGIPNTGATSTGQQIGSSSPAQ